MKKLVMTVCVVLSAACLVGCGETESREKHASNIVSDAGSWEYVGAGVAGVGLKCVVIKGHEYIVMDGSYCGTIIHAESCPCRSGR